MDRIFPLLKKLIKFLALRSCEQENVGSEALTKAMCSFRYGDDDTFFIWLPKMCEVEGLNDCKMNGYISYKHIVILLLCLY